MGQSCWRMDVGAVCLFRSWQIVSTKTHHPKKQRDVEGSIFLPLVAHLEHTHMKSSPQFATRPNPLLQTKEFQNLLVTGQNQPHKTLSSCSSDWLSRDLFSCLQWPFWNICTWSPFLNLQPNPLLQTKEFQNLLVTGRNLTKLYWLPVQPLLGEIQNPNDFLRVFNSQKWGENFSKICQIFIFGF
jgi:hypothetical protein